jgi:hypothetical protein
VCGAFTDPASCAASPSCEVAKPRFDPNGEWQQLLVKAGSAPDIKELPKDMYLKAAKEVYPHLTTKMERWVKEVDTQDDQKVSQDEFMRFRSYIHKVSDSGCAVAFKKFEANESSKKEQFSLNSQCVKSSDEATCAANT